MLPLLPKLYRPLDKRSKAVAYFFGGFAGFLSGWGLSMRIVSRALLVAVFGFGFASAASAADMPVKAHPLPAGCASNDITRANSQIKLDATGTYINYGPEYANGGPPLDSEKGWVPGLSVTGSWMGNLANVCNLYVMGSFTWMKGHTNYWASGGPVLANVDGATVYDFDFRFGKGFDFLGPNTMVTPYFGIGTNSWTRLLAGVSGYQEIYSHDYAGVGLLLQYAPAPHLVLSANGLVGKAFNSSMTASQTITFFPGLFATYPLGNKMTYMAGASADYAFTEHWHGNIGIDYTYFAYGQSPVNAGGFFEPNSATSYVTVSAGLGYAW